MTGTPLMNRPEEFWAILHMLTSMSSGVDPMIEVWEVDITENPYLNQGEIQLALGTRVAKAPASGMRADGKAARLPTGSPRRL
jgi:hypothetical protein